MATLSIASATPTDAGNYTLIASNPSGSATSAVAVVKVGLVLVNPSFEVDTFTVYPGYVSGNFPITGWNALGGHGINTAAGPFADNGTIRSLGGYSEFRSTRNNIGRETIDERQFRFGLRFSF